MKNIFLKSKAKSLQKTGGGDSQKNVHHLGVASEMPPRCLRDASVSIYSCQSDFSSRVWKYAAMLLMVLTLGVGQMWGADPQDTYYTFPNTKTSGQTVSPVSGENNDITVGSNGVVASAYTFAGTAYTNGLKLGNTLAKGATLSIPGSTTNPAHVFIVCSGSNKDVYLELNSTKEATANVYSSTSPIPGVMELVVTKSGNYNLYASGDVFCYEIIILYEKNTNIVKTYLSGADMSITSSSAWDSETEELLFFKPMEVTVDKTNKRYTFGGSATAPSRRTITFTAQANGSLLVGAMCSNNSNRNLMLKELSSGSFSDALVTSSNIQKGATTTLEYASISKGKTYVLVASGSDMHVTSIEFTASGGGDCTSPTIEWATEPAGGEVGASDFVASVTTTPAEQTVTWTSSVPAAATVSNGTIHYVAPGFTKITAGFTYSGDDYCEETVSVNKDIVVPISTDATGENDKYWYYTTAVPSGSPDNGLNYSGTKSGAGMYGTKLNSDGYAWFVKPAVAGTLRVGAFKSDGSGSNYAVEVYACDNEGTISGDALGTLTTPRAGGVSPTMDIAAEVEGIRIKRSTNSEGVLYFVEFKAAPAVVCAATIPGNISKGEASGGTGTITLTAAGEIASGDTWYWQSAEDGTATNLGDGATKNVSAPATWYIRSYNTAANCWSAAKSVTVDAADLLTAISPTLSYDANVIVGNTASPTLEGNAGSGSVTYALNDVTPAGSLTINESTGVVTAVTVGGTATVTATIAANGNYAAGSATSGTITVVANPLGTHTLTWTMKVGKSEYSSLLDEPSSTSTYMTAGGTLNYGSSTTIDAGNKGAENRTIKVLGVATSTEEHGAESYVEFPFTITSGYTFTPTAVSVKVANVSIAKHYDLVLLNADGSQSVARATFESEKTDGSVEPISWSSISGLTLRGSGKLRVYAFNRGATDGFRFGTPITITGTVAEYVPVSCSAYEFHYGTKTQDNWEIECFAQVGETDEWRITNFAIPSSTHFYVGYHGDGEGTSGWNATWSAEKQWTDTYSDGNGAMVLLPGTSAVGQATGAQGSLIIWSNSGDKNKYVGFKPNGYGITYGGSSHAFALAAGNAWETDVVTLPDVSTEYTMGLATATEGTYVACAHSSAAEALSNMGVSNVGNGKKKIYLVPGSFDKNEDEEKYAIYDKTADKFDTDFMTDEDGDGVYEGYVSSDCASIILVRMSSEATTEELANKDWTHKWNQTTGDGIAISGTLAKKYTITSLSGDNCSYTEENVHPATGQKGKFRMWDNSGSQNWYVTFVPYYTLSYNGNGASGSTAATQRSSESSTLTVTVADNGFTAPAGKHFAGWAISQENADAGTVDYAAGAGYELTADATLFAVWETTYAQNIDLATYAQSHSGTAWQGYLTDNGYSYVIGSEDGAEISLDNSNAFDTGLKLKKSTTSNITFNVAAGKLVTIITGNIAGMTYAVNGGAATALNGGSDATHLGYNYLYNAAAQNIVLTESNTTYNILREIKIENPYTVTYNANGGEDVAAATFYGTALTLPSASKGTDSFLGWFTEASGGTKIGEAGGSYTPSASIELFAHWEAVSTDARLASITFSSNAGTLEPAFDPEVVNYTYTMPYGTAAVPTITGATSVNANAQAPEIVSQAAAWNETAVIRGVAQSGDKKAYNVTMKIAPKDGLEIIGAAVTGNTTADVTGLYAGTASVKLSSKKIDSDCYIYVTLKEGQTLQDGDVLVVDVHTKSDIGTKALEICTGESNLNNGILTSVAVDDYSTGENSIVLESVPAGATSIGLKRSANLNAKINGLKVYRAMNPVLTAITIDGRAGAADELVENKFNVTIPYEANLASLTIEPTIYRNAAHATTPEAVISNEGAWVFGNNTYRVMDKDGDYTDYIIALTRDVLKHTVSFNTHGGSAVASVEVEDGETLDAAPAAPTKEDYIFQYWSESDGGAEIDVTTVQVNDDVEFHAVWAAEPEGIKLFDGEGNLNTTNFISPAKTTITISDVEYPTLVAFGSNRDDLSGAKQADLVMYSATTNATKIKFDLYNNNGSAKTAYLWMVEEGATESGDPIEIEIEGKTRRVTGYYTFDSNKNRSFYLTSSAKADIKVLQVKVIESGSAIPQFGQAGYSVSFNKGRLAAMANATVQFEGASIHSNADYAVLSNTDVKPKTYIQFENAVANTTVKIKRTSSNAYYVTNDLDNKGTSYTTDQEIVMSTTGTWYIGSVNSGSVAALSKIEFIAPKCEAPAFNALANSDICSGDAYVALDGTGTVSDGGSITYKWYAQGDAETVLATTATYMPEADGSYYVVALHHVDGYTDNEVTSDVVTVTTHAGTAITEGLVDLRGAIDDVVTLSVDAEGANLHYTWKECATIDGTYTDVAGAADAASLEVTVTEGMSKYYKVIVHSDCGDDLESIAHVTQFVPVVQQDVTSSIIWDWTKAASVNEIKLTDSTTPKKNDGFVMANGAATVYNNANFESDKLYLEGEYIVRDGKYFQGQMIKFNTTTAGLIRVKFSHTGNNKPARELYINGVGTGDSRTSATAAWSRYVEVPAGEVSITSYFVDPTEGTGIQYIRVPQIEFYALDKVRDDSWIAPRELGTVCYPNGHIVIGADMYKMAGVNENGKFAFDQVDVTEPGVPYLFEATGYEPIKFYKTTAATAEEAGTSNGMVGTFVDKTLTPAEGENLYYFQGTHFYSVAERTKNLSVPANRCYVDLNEPHPAAAPKAGVRRIVFGVNGTNSATGIESISDEGLEMKGAQKMLINGKIYILRGEKMYDATGRLVK